MIRIPLINRLQKRLKVMPNGCLEWQGATDRNGYGQIHQGIPRSKKLVKTHRTIWETANGPIPKGLCVLHTCDNPPCCNIKHLWLGTDADNNADMINKERNISSLGEENGRAKLSWEQIPNIKSDNRFHRIIAAEYGVDRTTIARIKTGKTWRNNGKL